jgi:hypothetical protein
MPSPNIAYLLCLPPKPSPKPPATATTVGVPEVTPGTPKVVKVQQKLIIRQEQIAQDGQTPSETQVREALWRLAERSGSTGATRVVAAGYNAIAKEARLSVNCVKANLQGLRSKLAIEQIPGKVSQAGACYRIFGYRETLDRRRAAGLTHYIKKNSAVTYVDPTSGVPTLGIPNITSGVPTLATPGVPTLGTFGIPTLGTPSLLGIVFSKEQKAWALEKLKEADADPSDLAIARKILGREESDDLGI